MGDSGTIVQVSISKGGLPKRAIEGGFITPLGIEGDVQAHPQFHGGPKQAIERIRVLRDVGITQIGMLVDFGSLPQAEIMRSLEIFARDVLPHVREL